MVHKPKHKVHSFRGNLEKGGEYEINLERSNVNLAYRIIKFQTMLTNWGQVTVENVTKVYRESQSSIDMVVNFADPDLLAANCFSFNMSANYSGDASIVIFDNVLFSRNIFVTTENSSADENINWYLELEEVPVGPATLMQLKLGVARKLNLEQ